MYEMAKLGCPLSTGSSRLPTNTPHSGFTIPANKAHVPVVYHSINTTPSHYSTMTLTFSSHELLACFSKLSIADFSLLQQQGSVLRQPWAHLDWRVGCNWKEMHIGRSHVSRGRILVWEEGSESINNDPHIRAYQPVFQEITFRNN